MAYWGNKKSRQTIQQYEFYFAEDKNKPNGLKQVKFSIMITSFEISMLDSKYIHAVRQVS